MSKMKNSANFLSIMGIMIVLKGCVAAAPIIWGASWVTTGFSAFKLVQLTTGGSVGVNFSEEEKQISEVDKEALSSIKHLAIFPGHTIKVRLAEKLQDTQSLQIITPYQVEQADMKAVQISHSTYMMESEKLDEYARIGKLVNADAVLDYVEEMGGYNSNFWSFNRSEISTLFTIKIISVTQQRIIWSQQGEIVAKLGSKHPPQGEIENIVAGALVEKLDSVLKI